MNQVLVGIFIYGIPEGIIVVFLASCISERKFNWPSLAVMGIIFGTIVPLARFATEGFIFTIVFSILILMLLLKLFGQYDIFEAVTVALLTVSFYLSIEFCNVETMQVLTGIDPIHMRQNLTLQTLWILPQFLITTVFAFVIRYLLSCHKFKIIMKMKLRKNLMKSMMENVYNWAILFFSIQSILIMIFLDNYYMKKYIFFQINNPDWAGLFLGFIILCLNSVVLIMVKKIYLSGLEAEQLKTTALKYTHLVEKNQIYRQHHHDLKNQLNVVLGLLTLGKYEELRDYLNSYLHTINDGMHTIETGLDEINLLFSSKLALAKSKEIRIDLTITVILKCSSKYINYLVAILGNLLDNAIEAVKGVDQLQRTVIIHFWEDPLEYIFEISNSMPTSNPCTPELYFKDGFTTKQKGRGQGLFIVKKMTERLDGNVTVDPGSGQFRVTLEIPKHRLQE